MDPVLYHCNHSVCNIPGDLKEVPEQPFHLSVLPLQAGGEKVPDVLWACGNDCTCRAVLLTVPPAQHGSVRNSPEKPQATEFILFY